MATRSKHSFSPEGLVVKPAGKLGRGVFATKLFQKGDLIEHAPILVVEDPLEAIYISQLTVLGSYVYEFDDDRVCVALGYASLYNHSPRPNAVYEVHEDCIEVLALREIKPGTQIKINYNGDPKDRTPINWDEWSRT